MDPQNRAVSKEFPPGYGDVALVTRDNCVFYFPRFLLSHTSPVFRDMLQSQNYSIDNPLHVNEDRTTIDLYLHHIDPTKPTPNLDKDTIFGLLDASRRYQTPMISQTWLSDQLIARDNTVNSVVREQPMVILNVGEEYNLPNVAQVALREIIMADATSLINPQEHSISHGMWRHITRLRVERHKFLSNHLIRLLLRTLQTTEPLYQASLFTLNSGPPCPRCIDAIGDLILEVSGLMAEAPSWERFERLLRSGKYTRACAQCNNTVCSLVQNTRAPPPLPPNQGANWMSGMTGFGSQPSTGFGNNPFNSGPSTFGAFLPQATGFPNQSYNPYAAPPQFQPQTTSLIPQGTPTGHAGYVAGPPVADYESVKRAIQQKESELPELPNLPPPRPSPSPLFKPVRPL
ncbi:hypothetical protein FS842_009419 [Serendipita sp. 407]|nr:hypothetical protein FS842_009419 [Serendipita sp. 407]